MLLVSTEPMLTCGYLRRQILMWGWAVVLPLRLGSIRRTSRHNAHWLNGMMGHSTAFIFGSLCPFLTAAADCSLTCWTPLFKIMASRRYQAQLRPMAGSMSPRLTTEPMDW